jgi:hypothetical protein
MPHWSAKTGSRKSLRKVFGVILRHDWRGGASDLGSPQETHMNEHPPGTAVGYHEDFYAWTREQAKRLRALGRLGRDLPIEIDLAHVAEEIEDLGKAELRGVTRLIRLIFVHLLEAASAPDSDAVAHWRAEATAFHIDMLDYWTPSMRQRIDVQDLWVRARALADARLREHGSSLAADLPVECPFGTKDVTTKDFRFDDALARLRSVRSPGATSSN